MNKFLKKLSAVAASMAIAVGMSATAFASFGPDRTPLTWNGDQTKGADHVVFNSFVNNPVWGDERDFVRGAVEQRDDKYADPVNNVKEGDLLNVVLFVHNNADASKNADGSGVALNTTVKADIPAVAATAQQIKGYVMADNAVPATIFDTVDVNGANAFSLQYVPGSVKISGNNINQSLPNADITKGFKIGDALDGKLPGCFDFIQYVTFQVKITTTNISIEKTVRKLGDKDWVENVNVKPGDTVEYRLKVTNTGKTDLTNIAVGDRLPPYLVYVAGTTRLYNLATPAEGVKLNDGITDGALRLNATYQPGSSAFIVFQAKVDNAIKDKECGSPRLRNIGSAHSDQVTKDVEDTADVVVDTGKTCAPAEKPKQLPKTGAGDVLGIFAAVTVAGAVAHRLVYARRQV